MKKVFIVLILSLCLVGITQAKGGKLAVGVNGVVALPMGDFGDFAKTGFGATGTFLFRVIPQLDVTGTIGYLTFGVDVPTVQGANIKADGSFSSIPILFGGRYYFMPGKVQPYGAAEIGLHISSGSDTEVSFTNPFTGQTTTQTVEGESSTNLGFGFGGGVLIEAGKNLKFDGGVQFNIISTTGSSSSYISIEAGVLFGLN